jgi:hypothetical protein
MRVYISAEQIEAFNAQWPCSPIEARPHFVDFEANGDLVDHNFDPCEDGSALLALISDAQHGRLHHA